MAELWPEQAASPGGPRGAEDQPGDSSGFDHVPMEPKDVGGGEADGQPR